MTDTIVIGDIHGCLEEFDEILNVTGYTKGNQRLILAGDLSDRGPDSLGVVRRAQEIGAECVLGNHDDWHVRYWYHEQTRKRFDTPNPMKTRYPESTAINASFSDDDISWMASLPRMLFIGGRWIVVHAGLEPRPIPEQDPDVVTRIRYLNPVTGRMAYTDPQTQKPPDGAVFWTDLWKGPENVIYGHAVRSIEPFTQLTRTSEPSFLDQETVVTLGIDTGCCFGGNLTAAIFSGNTHELVQVRAKRAYKVVPGGVEAIAGKGLPWGL